jgi:hypothetical protein
MPASPLDRLRRALAARLGVAPAAARPKPAAPAPKRRRRPRRPRDVQRARVYRWEAAHVFPHAGSPLSLEACRALVEAAYRWAEAPADALWRPPLVTDGRGRRHACGSREVVKLPRWARTPAVVLHECAHGLAPRAMHGPAFVAAYVALLERFAGLDGAALRASLAGSGVEVGPPPPLGRG